MTQEEIVSALIGKTIGLYPNEIINLLTENGVVVDADNLDINELIKSVFNGINTNPKFKKDLGLFIDSKDIIYEPSEYANADASTWIGAGTSLLGSIGGFLGSKDQLKAAQASANATLASNQTALEIEKLRLQGILASGQIQANAKNTPASNTALYIGLGFGGIIIVGLMVFLITQKNNNK